MTSNKGDRNHTPQSEYKKGKVSTFLSSLSLVIILEILFFDPENQQQTQNNFFLLPFWPNSKERI